MNLKLSQFCLQNRFSFELWVATMYATNSVYSFIFTLYFSDNDINKPLTEFTSIEDRT